MRTASVTLQSVSKQYVATQESWAVDNVSLSIYPRELTALTGPSGSGKTTLLSLIGCILAPTCGSLTILGQDAGNFTEQQRQQLRRKHIGFIFQSSNLLTSLTAQENVQLALSLRSAGEEASDLLAAVKLSEKADSYPNQLSGGQRQRVAIARAIAGNPELLLADEPTAALDAVQGRSIMELLRRSAHESGATVIVVSHDPRMIRFADRVVELEDGAIRRCYRLLRESHNNLLPTVPVNTVN